MRPALDQAIHDAKETRSWMEDNNEGNTNVGYLFALACLDSTITYLERVAAAEQYKEQMVHTALREFFCHTVDPAWKTLTWEYVTCPACLDNRPRAEQQRAEREAG